MCEALKIDVIKKKFIVGVIECIYMYVEWEIKKIYTLFFVHCEKAVGGCLEILFMHTYE